MAVEIFSKKEFEAALPAGFWVYSGFIDGEHTYSIEITADIFITIRSSIGSSGFSAKTGEDSIRAWLVGKDGKPLGSKVSKWTTRTKGWEERLLRVLRTLWAWAKKAGYCPTCKIPKNVFVVKKAGKNKGRVFCKCGKCGNGWEWLS